MDVGIENEEFAAGCTAVRMRRALGASEGRALLADALVLTRVAAAALYEPRVVAWPLAAIVGWCGISLASQVRVHRAGQEGSYEQPPLRAAPHALKNERGVDASRLPE